MSVNGAVAAVDVVPLTSARVVRRDELCRRINRGTTRRSRTALFASGTAGVAGGCVGAAEWSELGGGAAGGRVFTGGCGGCGGGCVPGRGNGCGVCAER